MQQENHTTAGILHETHHEIERALGAALYDLTVERAVIGLFFTGVKLDNGQGGVCYTPIKTIPEAVCCPSSARAMPASGELRGAPAATLVNDMWDGSANQQGRRHRDAQRPLGYLLEPPAPRRLRHRTGSRRPRQPRPVG